MLVIGTDQLGESEISPEGEPWYPIPGIIIEVSGWKNRLYALYFLPVTMRLFAEGVHRPYNPGFTKKHNLGGEGESSLIVVGGYVFVIDASKRSALRDLQFRWKYPHREGA